MNKIVIDNLPEHPQSKIMELMLHAALPYRMVTPTEDDEMIAEIERVYDVYRTESNWQNSTHRNVYQRDGVPPGESPEGDFLYAFQGGTRHSSPKVRKATYRFLRELAVDRMMFSCKNKFKEKDLIYAEGEASYIFENPFFLLPDLVWHAGADPDIEAISPLFDYPKPDRLPQRAEDFLNPQTYYWASLLAAFLTFGNLIEQHEHDWYDHHLTVQHIIEHPEIWDLLKPERISNTGKYYSYLTPPAPNEWGGHGVGALHTEPQIMGCTGGARKQFHVRFSANNIALVMLNFRKNFVSPLCEAMSEQERQVFHVAVSELPIQCWARWVFQMPKLEAFSKNQSPSGLVDVGQLDSYISDSLEKKFWRDLVDWWEEDGAMFSVWQESFCNLLWEISDETAEYMLATMNNPHAIDAFFPHVWFMPGISEGVGLKMIRKWGKEVPPEKYGNERFTVSRDQNFSFGDLRDEWIPQDIHSLPKYVFWSQTPDTPAGKIRYGMILFTGELQEILSQTESTRKKSKAVEKACEYYKKQKNWFSGLSSGTDLPEPLKI